MRPSAWIPSLIVLAAISLATSASSLCLVFTAPSQRDYVIGGDSELRLHGADPIPLAGSITIRGPSGCERPSCSGFWFYGEQLDVVAGDLHWLVPSSQLDPIGVSHVGERVVYIEQSVSCWSGFQSAYGVAGTVASWSEATADGTLFVHQTTWKPDPPVPVEIHWGREPSALPAEIAFSAVVHEVVHRCTDGRAGRHECSVDSDVDVGVVRIVARTPEAGALASGLVAWVALASLRRRARR